MVRIDAGVEVDVIDERRKNLHIRTLMATTNEGLIVVGADGAVRMVNERAGELFGLDRGEAIGLEAGALGCEPLAAAVSEVLESQASAPPITFEHIGRTLSCRLTVFGEEEQGGIAIVVRDDTDLIVSQERAEAILAGTGDGLIVFDPDGRVTYANPAAIEMLGDAVESAIGQHTSIGAILGVEIPDPTGVIPCYELRSCSRIDCAQYGSEDLRCWIRCGTPGPEGTRLRYSEKREICLECEVFVRNALLLGDVGSKEVHEVTLTEPEHRVIEVRTNPVIDRCGMYLGCVSSLHDVTAEREIAVMKNEFVSMVSHELRTPLTSIKGYVDLIVDGEAGEINDIQKEFLQIVQENSDRLVSLINDLLDISRIESGRVHLKVEPIDMGDIAKGVVYTFRTMAEGQKVDLRWSAGEGLARAAGDRDRVGQVLMNLVSNAIKYSPGGGNVEVAVSQDGGEVLVEVTDTGIGIALEDQEQLFSKFYRVDSRLTREIGGTGLGLSICKTVVELLGGRIGVRSEEGKGSTFWFTLPVAPADLVRTPSFEAPLDTEGGLVLVVDRDPEVASLVATYLVKRGYDVLQAHSAQDAYALAIEHNPRAITLDVMLDDMDGFELLQRLKDDARTAETPVVILSVVCDEGKSLRTGAANYLEKPIDQSRLVSVIDGLVGSLDSPLVLVVDDDHSIVRTLSDVLRARGFSTAQAYNGREALATVEKRRPDLMLLDLHMPVMDGYQVIQAIKSSDEWRDIPIVVMTAHRLDEDRVEVLNLAAEQLAKPFSAENLADHVERLLVGEVGDGKDTGCR